MCVCVYIKIYICIFAYIYIYIYQCNHKKNVPCQLSPQSLRCNSWTWARDVKLKHELHELPQSCCGDN